MNSKKATVLGVVLAAACSRLATTTAAPIAAPPASGAVAATALAMPEVGSNAPNFAFTPVTKDGVGKPKKLSDYKGQTVVLWFFIKARTRG